MKHARILIGLGVLALSAMPALAKPAYVASTVNLRAAPGTKSEIVAKIPGGSLIDAGDCSEGWCEITFQDKKGFAIQTALDLSGHVPRQAAARRPAYNPAYGASVAEAPDDGYVPVDEPVYYGPPPPAYYYGTYYRPYWGWHRHW
jgi:uncharacterized protein YraI